MELSEDLKMAYQQGAEEAAEAGYESAMLYRKQVEVNQQAYDRAMAHNALLREALDRCCLCVDIGGTCLCCEAINATQSTIKTWLEERDKKAVEDYLGQGAYPEVCKQLATVTTERDCALAHVATMVERLERLVCDLTAPAFVKGEHRGTWWYSSYASILNDIKALIKKTKPDTLPLLESLKHSAKLDAIEKLNAETATKLLMEALHPDLMALREVALEESRVRLQEQMEQVCLEATEAKKEGQQC